MKKHLMSVLAAGGFLAFAAFLLLSCGGGGGGGSSNPPATSTVIATACTGTVSDIVNAVGTTSWNPAAVTISVNDIVQWTNSTGVAHTVTSTTVPADGTFDASLPNNSSVCFKFTATGTFNYHCSIHPIMTGTVTVN